jgi:nitrile hydratase accessory protein
LSPPDDIGPSELPGLLRDASGPVFEEPWQAHAFALTVQLHARGTFSWAEWSEALATELHQQPALDDPARYYEHWLAALERLLCARGITDRHALDARRQAWAQAHRETPHGMPVLAPGARG